VIRRLLALIFGREMVFSDAAAESARLALEEGQA
jgi:hypothetical protein